MDWIQFYYDSEQDRVTNAKRHWEMTGQWPHLNPSRFDRVGSWQPNQAFPKRLPGSEVYVRNYYDGYKIVGWVDSNNNFNRWDVPPELVESIDEKIYNTGIIAGDD